MKQVTNSDGQQIEISDDQYEMLKERAGRNVPFTWIHVNGEPHKILLKFQNWKQ